jgi:hypothetical protein
MCVESNPKRVQLKIDKNPNLKIYHQKSSHENNIVAEVEKKQK